VENKKTINKETIDFMRKNFSKCKKKYG